MATRLPEVIHGFTTVPSREFVSNKGWVGEEVYNWGGSVATLVHQCKWNDRHQLVFDLLGSAESAGGGISRKLPARHPQMNWLFADRIVRTQGVGWKGVSGGANGRSSEYDMAYLTVQYSVPPFEVKEAVAKEHERFVIRSAVPNPEFIGREKGQYVWKAGTPHMTGERDFDAPVPTLNCKTKHIWKWMYVPPRVMNSVGVPTNIDAGVGKVNHADWAGFTKSLLQN